MLENGDDNFDNTQEPKEKKLILDNNESSISTLFSEEDDLLREVYMPPSISEHTPQMINGMEDSDMPVPLPLRQREAAAASPSSSAHLSHCIISPFWSAHSNNSVTESSTNSIGTSSNIWSQTASAINDKTLSQM